MKRKFPQHTVLCLGVCVAVLALGLILSAPAVTQAQGGGVLTYGALAYGTIAADNPLLLYSFKGTQGDLVQINLQGLSSELIPFVDLLAPDRQPLASAVRAPLMPDPAALQIMLHLPQTGLYSLMVGSTDNTTGDFLLELNGRPSPAATPLIFGQSTLVNVPANATPQYFTFAAEATCPTALSVVNPAPGAPYTFPFIVKILNDRAQQVAILQGGDAMQDRITVAPQSGMYEVEVWAADPIQAGSLELLVTCAGDPQACVNTATAAGGANGASGCPACEPCPGDSTSDDPVCGAFDVMVSGGEDGVFTFAWPAIEGANGAIVSANAEDGTLVYARIVLDTLTDTIDFPFWDAEPGPYTVHISVGSEELGFNICADSVAVNYEGQGPVHWGPAAGGDDECEVAIIAPVGSMANGLQTFFWTDVPGAESYRLRIFGEFDSVVADGAITAPATSMTLDASEASIGVGYGGENDFYAQIDAYRDGASWCNSGVRLTRND